ncbi:hypothetical protein DPMN_112376 [Dreissena polymorpha]|uniref:Uncharacterized protein n=1 Tax=Dreissena polymorpha TaxID=45954 RepID=A0A9D4KFL1_DREPO|nr:hypothetical protein DPMN_112376 [Dreissena polymorpha]
MTYKLALTQMYTKDNVQASTNTDVHNLGRFKLALTRMSTTEDMQAVSNTDVHNR